VSNNPSVERYDRRASAYDAGLRGRWHADIVERTTKLVQTVLPVAGRVLDVGCGSGALLRALARDHAKVTFVGIDPAPHMLTVAVGHPSVDRAAFARAVAEALPVQDRMFDLVVSSVSFGHWADQRKGLRECRRVLVDDGHLVLVDVFARWLNVASGRGSRRSAHNRARTTALLKESGFQTVEWHDVYTRAIAAAIAR
jgi:ubiquinone/menaquinone biosynthesis C-methylase UbiE